MKNVLCLTAILLFALTTAYAQNCNLNEDAQRYWVRANAAIKDAKNDADYLNAVEEFKKAAEYAPDCPDIYYNIGMCYDKSASSGLLKDIWGCGKAMEYLKKYLEIKPDAQNKQEVQNKIYELEYKYDKLQKFIGKYGGVTVPIAEKFEIKVDNNQIIAIVPQSSMETKYDTLVVENYKNTERKEVLKFFQRAFISYLMGKDIHPMFQNITYYLIFENGFVFQYYIDGPIFVFKKNNKLDVEATRIFNGWDRYGNSIGDGSGFPKKLLTEKITKIE